jgi:hypothetical protein
MVKAILAGDLVEIRASIVAHTVDSAIEIASLLAADASAVG